MWNYWFVNAWFNMVIYCVQASVYYLFGRYVSRLTFFTDTDPQILILTFFGWGMCSVSMAFLFSSFIN